MWGLAGAMVTQFSVFFYLTFVLEEEYGWYAGRSACVAPRLCACVATTNL